MLADSEFRDLVLRLMVRMTRVDGSVADDELVRVRWILQRMFGDTLGDAQLRAQILERFADPVDLDDVLRRASDDGTLAQQRQLMKVAFVIATADGQVVDVEDGLLKRIARGLAIEPKAYAAMCSVRMIAREFL